MTSEDHQLISIIMPVYNRQDTITYSISSIVSQTYTYFELIVIDDGSTDKTASIVQSFSDNRIKYIGLNENVGAAAARNIGLKRAKGQWISFQDSDDYWEPEKLSKQVQLINVKSPSIIFTSFIRYKNGVEEYIPKNRKNLTIPKEGYLHKQLLQGNFIATPTVILPKVFLEQNGAFNDQMPRFQDWELWLRLSVNHPFIWVDEPLVRVKYTEDSISSSDIKLIQGYEMIWKIHKQMFINAGQEHVARFLFSFGHNLSLCGDTKKGRKVLVQSLQYKFFSYKQFVCLGVAYCLPLLYKQIYKIYNS